MMTFLSYLTLVTTLFCGNLDLAQAQEKKPARDCIIEAVVKSTPYPKHYKGKPEIRLFDLGLVDGFTRKIFVLNLVKNLSPSFSLQDDDSHVYWACKRSATVGECADVVSRYVTEK